LPQEARLKAEQEAKLKKEQEEKARKEEVSEALMIRINLKEWDMLMTLGFAVYVWPLLRCTIGGSPEEGAGGESAEGRGGW